MMQFNQVKFQDSFEIFKDDFKKHTGAKWDRDMSTYIEYVNMRMNNQNAQINEALLNDYRLLINELFAKIEELQKQIIRTKG
jgi:hypothetical protein